MSEQKIFCGLNHKKLKRWDLRGIRKEANRELDDYKNYVDPERSHLNYYYIKSDDFEKDVDDLIQEYDLKRIKRNSTLVVSTVVYASADFFKNASEGQIKAYFDESYKYMCGRGKVINAVVHYDETTPHMQVAWIPFSTELKNTGKEPGVHAGISARDLVGSRRQLSMEQTAFYEQVGKHFGLERGAIRIDTDEKKEHLSELEYKTMKETEKLQRLQAESSLVNSDVERLKVTKKSLTADIKQLNEDVMNKSLEYDDFIDRLNSCKRDLIELERQGRVKEKTINRLKEEIATLEETVQEYDRTIKARVDDMKKSIPVKTSLIHKDSFLIKKDDFDPYLQQHAYAMQQEREQLEQEMKERLEQERIEQKRQLKADNEREINDYKEKLKADYKSQMDSKLNKFIGYYVDDKIKPNLTTNKILESLERKGFKGLQQAYNAEFTSIKKAESSKLQGLKFKDEFYDYDERSL